MIHLGNPSGSVVWRVLAGILCTAAGCAAAFQWIVPASLPAKAEVVSRPARISPDYADCCLPPNIAPTNFVIEEAGDRFLVRISGENGTGWVVEGNGPDIRFPLRRWRELLQQNRGRLIQFEVYARQSHGGWQRFAPIANRIASEEVDSHVSYRLLQPVQVLSANMGTYQRELSSFRETAILESKDGRSNRCVNCHTYANRNPDSMLLHMRGAEGVAMLLLRDQQVTKIDTRSGFHSSPGSYSAWHPNERMIAVSFNSMFQFFHTAGARRDVFVFDSDIGLYLVDTNQIVAAPPIADPEYIETFPDWSPEGDYLYFSRYRRQWDHAQREETPIPPQYREVRFDLCRVSFDEQTGEWGIVETIVSGDEIGRSVLEPRVSPDGRRVLVSLADYGSFPVFHDSSDLWFVDVADRSLRPLTINSHWSDSWHAWSSNGRWIVFASKRGSGVFGRLYLAYVDEDGTEHKPWVLPQHDPRFYDTCLDNYNAPEFAVKEVNVSQREWLRAIYASEACPARYEGEVE
jgi:hypothetical protein